MDDIKDFFGGILVLVFVVSYFISGPLGLYMLISEVSEGALIFIINFVMMLVPFGGLINYLMNG